MATMSLQQYGGSITKPVSGFLGSIPIFGKQLSGQFNKVSSQAFGDLGAEIDARLFGVDEVNIVRGRRLSDLSIQSSVYGDVIPQVFGQARLAGNIIWARPIKETANTTRISGPTGGKGGAPKPQRVTETRYSYSATIAIAICEGEIDEVLRVWADATLINPADYASSYIVYTGSENQLPSAVIESFEGVGNTPAYRGLAYIVFEDFQLAEFGNRIPNFSFEVNRKINSSNSVEELVTAITLIPGSGEFVYDPLTQTKIYGEAVGNAWVQREVRKKLNQNNQSHKADILVSLDNLEKTLPNLNWVSVVCTWFGDSLNLADCTIEPRVDFQAEAITSPSDWNVAGVDRNSARLVVHDANGRAIYGGTPSDASIIRLLDELGTRGYQVMFYPMVFMDIIDKPWRGRITGDASEINNFFTKSNGYNNFILHYANLVLGKVNGFVIGSELKGITQIQDGSNNFPAVAELISLAAQAKNILGAGVTITYAADWSEYHSTNGWYNLDPLWASNGIDVVGIDAYFPLLNEPQARDYNLTDALNGWQSGEGYDFYFTDVERTIQAPLQPQYAWKNLDWWWNNQHQNPDNSITAWLPTSKPIWFTEYGFPSVDAALNQPNIFYNPGSVDSGFPYHSNGYVDFQAQRLGIEATENFWAGSNIVQNKFLWTWDARPYPFWPDLLDVWSDGGAWSRGHWIQGKFGISSLAEIVKFICVKAGLSENKIDVSRLNQIVDGYIINSSISAMDALNELKEAYFFDSVESDGVLKFVPRALTESNVVISDSNFVKSTTAENFELHRMPEHNLPKKLDLSFINKYNNYLIGNQHFMKDVGDTTISLKINAPLVLSATRAKQIIETKLFEAWNFRTKISFELSSDYFYLEPTDVINISVSGTILKAFITEISTSKQGSIKVNAIKIDPNIYDIFNSDIADGVSESLEEISATEAAIFELPCLPSDNPFEAKIRYAATGLESNWAGTEIYRSDDDFNFSKTLDIAEKSTIGTVINHLGIASANIFDEVNYIDVILLHGQLESLTESQILNGANIALVGDEIIQFQNATLIEPAKYRLTKLLRGRLGTEHEISNHNLGDRFILLDATISNSVAPTNIFFMQKFYKPVTYGLNILDVDSTTYACVARSLKPYSPAHPVANIDVSGDINISWIRRTRFGGELRDFVDAPLSENFEKYDLEILDGATVLRTVTNLTSANFNYTAAMQIVDFGALQTEVSVKIYQLSDLVGRGYPCEAVL